MIENKKKLEQVLCICAKCNIKNERKLYRNIHISQKMFYGCGKWKQKEKFILDQQFYDEIKKSTALRQVVDDLIKK